MTKIADYFSGVAAKKLSQVEVNPDASNQHEFNGVQTLKTVFGESRSKFDATFLFLAEEEEASLDQKGFITWYDSRENHPTRSEFRLYYSPNEVMEKASEGDLVIIGKRKDNSSIVIVAESGSTAERQLLWLFNIDNIHSHFSTPDTNVIRDNNLKFLEARILELIGIESTAEERDWLSELLREFGESFPKTTVFSAFARGTCDLTSSIEDPDLALLSWINHEEMLFRTLEKHIVAKKLVEGFRTVDEFIAYSLSVQNRRKSRMGFALENHLAVIFNQHNLRFDRQVITEQNSKPDFLFPGIVEYKEPRFPVESLTMLAAKSSCKERWNQVLAEANRIESKHLVTLEPAISVQQTDKMREKRLQLVLPKGIHQTFLPSQQDWLFSLSDFISLVSYRQSRT